MNLPSYEITLAQTSFDSLLSNPLADIYYPATFTIEDTIIYPCKVKYRGRSSLEFFPEKRSWKVKFENTNNIFGKRKLNLNAEYQDKSLMRNYLVMKFYQEMGYISSNVQYRNLFVNGNHMGLFIQIENVDEEFLEERGLPESDVFKAYNHAATMAPMLNFSDYKITWDKKVNEVTGYKDFQSFLYWLCFSSKEDFDNEISNKVEIPNILNYFATEFALSSKDCFTKNQYFYNNSDTGKYSFFPWDNDGSLGNVAPYDYYDDAMETLETTSNLEHEVLFRRLMDNTDYNQQFWDRVNEIRTIGFEYLNNEIDATHELIAEDFYNQADSLKVCSNEEFDNEMTIMHNFLTARQNFLDGFTNFHSQPLSNYSVVNDFPTSENQLVDFKVTSSQSQGMLVIYAYNISFDELGGSFDFATLHLFDDGSHNDENSGDLIYGNTLDTSNLPEGIIVYAYINYDESDETKTIAEAKQNLQNEINKMSKLSHQSDRYSYPYNGIFYLSYYKNVMLAINKIPIEMNINQVSFQNIYKSNNDYFLELKNNGTTPIDLSYCFLNYSEYFKNFILPFGSIIQPDSTLIITSNKDISESYFPNDESVNGLYFNLEVGDYLKLLSPSLNVITSKEILEFNNFDEFTPNIVINEINYNSSDDFDPNDWIELYNNSAENVDLSSWVFKDSDDEHQFIIPEGTTLEPNQYLVLTKNDDDFSTFFPDVTNKIGDFDFGLSGGGELIRLYDNNGLIVDQVQYDDEDPWPTEPDGNGPTLELINPNIENNLGENWAASENHGTPGEINSNYTGSGDNVNPEITSILGGYPNPLYLKSNSRKETTVRFSIKNDAPTNLSIYNIKGQKVKTLLSDKIDKGLHSLIWNGKNKFNHPVPSGVYFLHIKNGNYSKTAKFMVVK
jgi:hypothetical protein